MMFRLPTERCSPREIAETLIMTGGGDFQIQVGDTVLSVMNPGGVMGENIAQLVTGLRREVADLVDEIRSAGSQGEVAELEADNEKLKEEINELKADVNDFEESCGRLAK